VSAGIDDPTSRLLAKPGHAEKLLVEHLGGRKVIETQETVRLVETVLAPQRRGTQSGQTRFRPDWGESRVIEAAQPAAIVEVFGEQEDVPVALGACPRDKLRALAGGRKLSAAE
jgi:hypothetical protein